jgi:hypothetical protein
VTAVAPPEAYIAAVSAAELFVDRSYQRELSEAWVRKRVGKVDRRLLGVLDVSDRGEDWAAAGLPGRYAIVNGQHRHDLIVKALGVDHPTAVKVYEGLTVADEAELMAEIDRSTRKLTTWERWVARRASGDPVVTEIEAVLANHRLRMAGASGAGQVAAISSVEGLYANGGIGLVDATMGVLRSAWRDDSAAYSAPLVSAVGLILRYHGSRVDMARLNEALRRSRPWDVRSTAHVMRTQGPLAGMSLTLLVAAAIVDRYNRVPGPGRLAYPS